MVAPCKIDLEAAVYREWSELESAIRTALYGGPNRRGLELPFDACCGENTKINVILTLKS
jgi:hypothetical protein